ncbi:MAG: Hsp20/alpha crystallin family protein [Candidatus Aminicenantes bacterium]|jgi:HSP20 family protein
MAIIRWDPFRDLVTLREKMNRLFEEAYSARGEERDLVSSSWAPSVDIYETEQTLVLTAEVPGIEDKDIEIKIEDSTLTLKGERKFEKETEEENYHRIERAYGSFYRSFSLPPYIDQDKIEAEHEQGVLKITMPKKHESKPRTVKVLKATSKTVPAKKKKK